MKKTLLFFLLLCFASPICVSLAFGQSANGSSLDDRKERRIKNLIATLKPTNLLRQSLEAGDRRDSPRQNWMDKMDELSIRQAGFTISYLVGSGPLKLKVISSHYYYNYFDYGSAVSDRTRKQLTASRLDKTLEGVARKMASERPEQLVADFRRQYPSLVGNKKVFCGKIYVNLLNDEALPLLEQIPTIETACGRK